MVMIGTYDHAPKCSRERSPVFDMGAPDVARCPECGCRIREPIRDTAIKPKPAPSVTARRAERIEIDSCGDCPWLRSNTEPRCSFDGHGDGKPRLLTIAEAQTYEAPEWCPITEMVILIGGPRAER